MRVKIYQINSDRDADRQKFMSLNDDQTVSSAIYDEVFNAEIDETDLEAIYARFNTSHHPLFRGHSLSVSDVIVMDGKAHYVQSLGFKEIPFDEGQTQKPDNLMRVVYVEPNKPAYEAEVVGTLEGEQAAVQGYIEAIYFEKTDDVLIIGNEEAKLIGMEGNRHVGEDIIAGPFFVCGTSGSSFRGLTDEEVTKYMDRFKEPEQISQEEVQGTIGYTIFPGM